MDSLNFVKMKVELPVECVPMTDIDYHGHYVTGKGKFIPPAFGSLDRNNPRDGWLMRFNSGKSNEYYAWYPLSEYAKQLSVEFSNRMEVSEGFQRMARTVLEQMKTGMSYQDVFKK